MNLLYINIGKNIQEHLKSKQMSTHELAEQFHVTPHVLHQMVQGRKGLNVAEIQQIAEALHLDINEVVEDVHEKAKSLDTMSSIIAKIQNEHTKERLRFLEHVMERMLKIEGMTKGN